MSFLEIRWELEIATEPIKGLPTVAHATVWEAVMPPNVDESLEALGAALDSVSEATTQIQGSTEASHAAVEATQSEYVRILPENQANLTTGIMYHVDLLKSSVQSQTEIAASMAPQIDEARAALQALVEKIAQLKNSVMLGCRYAEAATLAKQGTVQEVDSFIIYNV